MRNATIYAKLKKIYEDKTSGASILAGKLFSVLKEKARETERKDDFLYFLKALKRDLKKHHPLLFQLQNLVDIILTLARSKYKVKNGVIITKVEPFSEAYDKGIRENDIIIEADRKPVRNVDDLKKIIQSRKSGEVILLRLRSSAGNRFVGLKIQ